MRATLLLNQLPNNAIDPTDTVLLLPEVALAGTAVIDPAKAAQIIGSISVDTLRLTPGGSGIKNVELARRIFYWFLPLIRYEAQGGAGLSVRKEIYRLRGLIKSGRLRAPSGKLDEQVHEELQRIAKSLGLSFSADLAAEPRDVIEREAT